MQQYSDSWGHTPSRWAIRHTPPRCTKCNSPPINGQCTNFILFDVSIITFALYKIKCELTHATISLFLKMQNRSKMRCGQPYYHKAGLLHMVRLDRYCFTQYILQIYRNKMLIVVGTVIHHIADELK